MDSGQQVRRGEAGQGAAADVLELCGGVINVRPRSRRPLGCDALIELRVNAGIFPRQEVADTADTG